MKALRSPVNPTLEHTCLKSIWGLRRNPLEVSLYDQKVNDEPLMPNTGVIRNGLAECIEAELVNCVSDLLTH
ncbi:hypothetical protein GF345_03985 [Candidatus Woesearchaeota archaeon]|nr:hypothetical protein [Candidatus Woesearchaeota archaeon]